ncbi:ECF RNA polymerase sigma factor SigD [Ktedonobacter sp. SOSP1-52]|nr:ECF RNA polymerase sigma factor SigD [Ktedonobacter sp. SOSP1-52]
MENEFMKKFLAPPAVSDDTDLEVVWIEAAQANPSAFEPLYLRYRERMYYYLRTRVQSAEDAADLTHQVFLQALQALPRYRYRGVPFSVWLFRIAHHTAVNVSSRRFSTVPWDAFAEAVVCKPEQDPESYVLRQETFTHVRNLLQTLPAHKRELLALRFAADLTVPEIAAIIGKRPDTIKKQLARLLQSLKEACHETE